jgi:hypothetical protein
MELSLLSQRDILTPLTPPAGLFHSPSNRQGLKSLANSPSRLKTTQLLLLSPLERTLAVRQGT